MSEQEERILRLVGETPECGSTLLNDVRAFIRRFCVFPDDHCLNAVTLWAAHAHMVEHFYSTPRLAMLSPEPSSGKTRVLDVLDLLVPEPMYVFNASPAAIFRTLDSRQITLLFDEVDTIWSKKGRNDNNEELRALLNAGYKRGAKIPRCTGPKFEVTDFKVFSAVAVAGIGELPETIMTRSIIVKMRRRGPGEYVEQFRGRQHSPEGHSLRARLAAWAQGVGEATGQAEPIMPCGVEDRPAEVWEAILAVGDAAGGSWPDIARKACVALIEAAKDSRVSLGVRLLIDLKTLFTQANTDKLSTSYLIDTLTSPNSGLPDDAPWADLQGKPIDPRRLARLLKPYGISSRKLRINETTQQGYNCDDLHDAWQRYVPVPSPVNVEHPEHAPQIAPRTASNGPNVPDVPDVPDARKTIETSK